MIIRRRRRQKIEISALNLLPILLLLLLSSYNIHIYIYLCSGIFGDEYRNRDDRAKLNWKIIISCNRPGIVPYNILLYSINIK